MNLLLYLIKLINYNYYYCIDMNLYSNSWMLIIYCYSAYTYNINYVTVITSNYKARISQALKFFWFMI
jgi:hypothetical protein